MTTVLEESNVFLADFNQREKALSAGLPRWVHRLRRAAIARFAEMGLPTTRQEEWRFTNLASLRETTFEPAPHPSEMPPLLQSAAGLLPQDGPRIVLVNGRYCGELSSNGTLPEGVAAGSLAESLRTHPERIEPELGRHADYREHVFTALSTALVEDGTFLSVRPGAVVEPPIYLLHLATGAERPYAVHPRHLILIGERAEVKIVETYLALEENVYFTNAVTELVLGEGAIAEHYKLQREGPGAFHIGLIQARQHRGSAFHSYLVSLGGRLARHETNVRLDAEGCHAELHGLYLAQGNQHTDCRTRIDHARSHCTSREVYKGILDDRAHGVFNGKIYVHPNAQKTDAKQTNKTLLLSDGATINAKPQLEIFADDVKCTHGATVGQLDREALFYLRSRGIELAHARHLLIYAFANEVLGPMQITSVRTGLERVLFADQGLLHETALEKTA
jgi:Fe-S cluster assembly protein SufD